MLADKSGWKEDLLLETIADWIRQKAEFTNLIQAAQDSTWKSFREKLEEDTLTWHVDYDQAETPWESQHSNHS